MSTAIKRSFGVGSRHDRGRDVASALRKRMRAENMATRMLRPTISRAVGRYMRDFNNEGVDAIDKVAVINTEEIARDLEKIYDKIMTQFGEEVFAAADKLKDRETSFQIRVATWIARNSAKAIGIEETIRKRVRKKILDGLEQGLTTAQITRDIRKLTPKFASGRARTIARTEVNAAASAGSDFAAEAVVESTGLRLEREWLAVDDERTRPSHNEADGQRRPMGEPFDVGGAKLMRPADPDGPAEEVINCRCALLYHRV